MLFRAWEQPFHSRLCSFVLLVFTHGSLLGSFFGCGTCPLASRTAFRCLSGYGTYFLAPNCFPELHRGAEQVSLPPNDYPESLPGAESRLSPPSGYFLYRAKSAEPEPDIEA